MRPTTHPRILLSTVLDLAVSGVDHSIKLLQPTPLPLDETEEEFADRIEKRKNGAAEVNVYQNFPTLFNIIISK